MIATIAKFFRFCRPEDARKFYLSLVLGVAAGFFKALQVPAIAIVLGPCIGINGPLGMLQIAEAAVCMAVALIGEGLIKAKSSMLQTEAGYSTASHKRIEIAAHLRYLPMGYFNKNSLGHIASVATNTMENLENVATRVVMLVAEGLIVTLLIAVMMFAFDWRVACVTLLGVGVVIILSEWMQHVATSLSKRKLETDAEQVAEVLEYVQGLAEVKSYGLVGERSQKLNDAIKRNVDANTRMELGLIPLMGVQRFSSKLTGVAICGFSVYFYLNQSMDMLTCIMMIICSYMIYTALDAAGTYSTLLRIVDGSVDLAEDILSTPVMDVTGDDAQPESCDVRMDDVSFAYDEKMVLTDVTLDVPDHAAVALVGPSGSGKTTAARLMARFWDPASGTVSLGEKDERTYAMDSLMRNFSFVFQHTYLFHDTVANNIRFGAADASMEDVTAAAKQACAYDFIMALPNGFDTVIGEGGATLSGGEQQRISIARAIMKDAPIVILDEATANVDPENEMDLMAAISSLARDKTVIIIAHRLKTVRDADRIYVLKDGRVVQSGRHDELMREGGVYRDFVDAREQAVSWRL